MRLNEPAESGWCRWGSRSWFRGNSPSIAEIVLTAVSRSNTKEMPLLKQAWREDLISNKWQRRLERIKRLEQGV
jgi:hypothetical protein